MKAAIAIVLCTLLPLLSSGQGSPYVVVLGNVQDGGSPHIGCTKACCRHLFRHPDPSRMIASLGLIDPEHQRSWIFDATPDLPRQMKLLRQHAAFSNRETPDGIFLTHAHIGHYAGLMYLGREAMNAQQVPVYVMPRMHSFLTQNGPWSQLVSLQNISLRTIHTDSMVILSSDITVTALQVPHRDEFSETAGFIITGPHKKLLFIPDIDKWSRWQTDITTLIRQVDYAFIDATFFDGAEINNRPISEIPHPFVTESMALFEHLSTADKNKIYFIHLNHTNPLLDAGSPQTKEVLGKGFKVARLGERVRI
ncbi:MBL fold metallo-hydrolase [Chitinophaga solisilvae]|uniref:MBL fold metallo-hydrolase n=1 Tax=Chitinophaga solisilvae TaxID=1233460 RepID=UPI0013698E65|nr:MBL fold metallo-hydrolase [Chitinophaga solisilvae]